MTKARYRFEIPVRVVAVTNRRGHWRRGYLKDKKLKSDTYVSWLGAGKPTPRLPASVTFTRIAPLPLDEGDNLESSFKAIRDCLVIDCWKLPNDGPKSGLKFPPSKQRRGLKRQYSVLVEIEELDE